MLESTEDNNPSGLLYSVRLLIRHPVLDVQTITDHLGIDPTYSWSVGDPGRSDTMWARNICRPSAAKIILNQFHLT